MSSQEIRILDQMASRCGKFANWISNCIFSNRNELDQDSIDVLIALQDACSSSQNKFLREATKLDMSLLKISNQELQSIILEADKAIEKTEDIKKAMKIIGAFVLIGKEILAKNPTGLIDSIKHFKGALA